MPREPRSSLPGGTYHCINRGVGRRPLFLDSDDYEVFIRLMFAMEKLHQVQIPAFCLMPNHWHIVLTCERSTQMSAFFKRLLNAHTKRHHVKYETVGHGPIYQGRFKSIYIEDEQAFNNTCNYVEDNPARAKLVVHNDQWHWSSRRLGQSRD